MKMWQVWTGMVIIFISGIAIGSVATFILIEPDEAEERVDSLVALRQLALNHVSFDLDLREDQERKFEKVVLMGIMRVLEWSEEIPPDVEKIIEESFDESATFLDAEQFNKLQRMYDRVMRLRLQVVKFLAGEVDMRLKELSVEQ